MKKKSMREGERSGNATPSRTAATVESQSPRFYYETQERAFAPGIADGWPEFIKAPHTPNGRLVRRDARLLDAAPDMLAALKYVSGMTRFHAGQVMEVPMGEWSDVIAHVEAAIVKAESR